MDIGPYTDAASHDLNCHPSPPAEGEEDGEEDDEGEGEKDGEGEGEEGAALQDPSRAPDALPRRHVLRRGQNPQESSPTTSPAQSKQY